MRQIQEVDIYIPEGYKKEVKDGGTKAHIYKK